MLRTISLVSRSLVTRTKAAPSTSILLKRRYGTEKGKEMADYGANHLSPGIGKISSVVMKKGQGSWIWDVDNNKYLDFTCGIAVTNTGHCHPKVVKAAQEQVGNLIHGQVNIGYHEPMLTLMQKLFTILPKKLDRLFFANSGAEAIENAIKLARHHTKRQNVIVFNGGFHGRTFGTMSLTTSKTIYRAGFGPLMAGVHTTPFPYCFRCKVKSAMNKHEDQHFCCGKYEEEIEHLLKMQTAPSETAAILVEPVQGEGGYVPAPKAFMKYLRDLCDKHGIMLIVDEVQTGFGRTGKFFAVEHYDIVPDIMVIAKGLASGFPLSAIASTSEIMKSTPPGSMGGTYAGNAVACAAASATIDVMKDEKLLDNTNARGKELTDGLKEIQKSHPEYQIVDVRGYGLMIGVEFDHHKVPYGTASKIIQHCVKNGMLLLSTGAFETLRFIPPLTVTKDEIQTGLNIFKTALKEAFASK
jgi:4-aminobutyrate aminotransferase